MNPESTDPPKVLVIDDEPLSRKTIVSCLEDRGFFVIPAENGNVGLERVHSQMPDVIFLDLRIPEMNGVEFLERLLLEAPAVPVIVVSGAERLQDAIEAMRHGAQDFIARPIPDMALLEHAVRRALERSRLLAENQRTREHLESEIERRTADLLARTRELENSNDRLLEEITQLKSVEAALKQREKEFRELTDRLPQIVFETDAEGRLSFINRYGAELVGSRLGKAGVGRFVTALFSDNEKVRVQAEMARLMAGGTPGSFESTLQHRDETTFPVAVYASPVLKSGDAAGVRGIICDITEIRSAEEVLRASEAKLRQENLQLKYSLRAAGRFGRIIGRSPAMEAVYDLVLKAAASNTNVIITGESGTGKELVARTIHALSDRREGKFITANCGAIPGNLLESEFFGYRKGAFAGAAKDTSGYLCLADRGTLFLDEIGEIPPSLQVKLLRVIEGGGFSPVGSSRLLTPDVRIIAATNRDLSEEIRKGNLREDFYYRIHIISICLPPLRQRREDIPALIQHFLNEFSDGKTVPEMPESVVQTMTRQEWPGNVRELQNAVHRFLALNVVEPSNPVVPGQPPSPLVQILPSPSGTLPEVMAQFERRYIETLLNAHHCHRSKVARILGIDRRTLFRKIKDHGL